ncbi:hypothetical protein CSPX01_07255, partial [Colletotrichum filicis]
FWLNGGHCTTAHLASQVLVDFTPLGHNSAGERFADVSVSISTFDNLQSPDDCQPFRTAKLSRISNAGAVMIENPTKTGPEASTSNTRYGRTPRRRFGIAVTVRLVSTMGTVSASGTSLWPHRSRRSSHIPDVPTFSSLAALHTPQWANVSQSHQ